MSKYKKITLGIIAAVAGFAFFFVGVSEDASLLLFVAFKAAALAAFLLAARPLGAFKTDKEGA